MSSAPHSANTPAPAPGTRIRRPWVVVAGAVALVLLALLGWWTLRNESQRITATTVAYRVEDDTRVRVAFDVSRPVGLAVTCTVRALDGRFGVVGSVDVVVPPEGDRTVRQQASVRTTSRAVTGVVQDCVRT